MRSAAEGGGGECGELGEREGLGTIKCWFWCEEEGFGAMRELRDSSELSASDQVSHKL